MIDRSYSFAISSSSSCNCFSKIFLLTRNLQDTQERQLLHLVRGYPWNPCIYGNWLAFSNAFFISGWKYNISFIFMAGFPSYIFVNIQPCLKKTTGFLKCFFCFWLAFSNYFLYMEKPLPAYDRHLNWLFGMFFSFPV